MERQARKAIAAELPSDLVARFEDLLFTYPLRQARGEVPWRVRDDPHTLESQFGFGHYDERKHLLLDTLQAVLRRGKVNGAGICNTLEVARTEYMVAQSAQINAELVEKLNVTRPSVHHRLKVAVQDALAFFRDTGYACPRPAWAEEFPPLLYHTQQLAQLLDEKRVANVLTRPLGPSVRAAKRPQGGRPATAWRRRAHADLRRLGVSRKHRDNFLQAVGLLPYSDAD